MENKNLKIHKSDVIKAQEKAGICDDCDARGVKVFPLLKYRTRNSLEVGGLVCADCYETYNQ
jgi:hypothetical protein